ncbi:hypothetical protein CCM_01577 [Cordyceps militaris CM01]|uniref:Uncharacterized protein n=1 Tax=Cordyceps militaris (strain CM01) TaxID=983644 RepID=G3J5W7_CORMM|nr:uncharacterized protein CCM_01577 [Cordyceps militaris CM01]EGX96919.1 hypothetical protein CCM_01577 [Cordyceps militaris CM01]
MGRDSEPQTSRVQKSPQSTSRRSSQPRLAKVAKKTRLRRPRPVEPGSVVDIIRQHPGSRLFERILCWTDQHAQLLGVQFNKLPKCDTPIPVNEPGSPPPKGHMQPSRTITTLSDKLTYILSYRSTDPDDLCATVRTIMGTLWPATFCRVVGFGKLHLYFGDKVYHDAVKTQCIWAYPGGHFLPSQSSLSTAQSTQETASQSASQSQQSSTSRQHLLTDSPMVCYMSKAKLESMRTKMFYILSCPNGDLNKPVHNLRRLWAKALAPSNADADAPIAGIMLAMAQRHFYANQCGREKSPAKKDKPFHDVRMRLLTHDSETAEFLVYTGHITATFLEHFRRPHKMPSATKFDGGLGLKIDYVRVPIWPILGLRERLGKALGEDLVGSFDPAVMETWEEDVVEAPTSIGSKRKRKALVELVNRSFEESDDEQPSPTRGKKKCIRPGIQLQAAA